MVALVVVVIVGFHGVPGKNALMSGARAFHRYVAVTVAVTEVPELADMKLLGLNVKLADSKRGVTWSLPQTEAAAGLRTTAERVISRAQLLARM
jgi:hypothetical protein